MWILQSGVCRIVQRNWRDDIDDPKSKTRKRPLTLGYLVERYRLQAAAECAHPEKWIFTLTDGSALPLWDSGFRQAARRAAAVEGCDLPGLGPHSFRRANIAWRQQEGTSSIEASKNRQPQHGQHDRGIHEDPTRPAGRTHAPDSGEPGERGSEAANGAAITGISP